MTLVIASIVCVPPHGGYHIPKQGNSLRQVATLFSDSMYLQALCLFKHPRINGELQVLNSDSINAILLLKVVDNYGLERKKNTRIFS